MPGPERRKMLEEANRQSALRYLREVWTKRGERESGKSSLEVCI